MKKCRQFIIMGLCLILILSFQISVSANPQEELYFPKDIFKPSFISEYRQSIGYENWYTKELEKVQAPNLYLSDLVENKVIYRFLLIESLYILSPIVITIEIDNLQKTGVIHVQIVCTNFYYEENSEKLLEKFIFLNAEQCEDFLMVINNNNFWDITPVEYYPLIILSDGREVKKIVAGSDGEDWIIEGKESDRYHVINRWSPDSDINNERDSSNKNVYSIGDYMLRLASLEDLWEEIFEFLNIHILNNVK